MNCSNCGSHVDGKFCPNCGTPIPVNPQKDQAPPSDENTPQCDFVAPENTAVKNELLLEKAKMLGAVTYKTIKTSVTIEADAISIKMDTKKIFRKARFFEKKILIADIQKAYVRTVMDFWDTLYGIIFAVLGFSAPILFLGTVVCLWCGYGKEIELLLFNGEKFHIPTNSSNSANALVNLLNRQ